MTLSTMNAHFFMKRFVVYLWKCTNHPFKDTYPGGLTFAELETALTEKEVPDGAFFDILSFMLITVFDLQVGCFRSSDITDLFPHYSLPYLLPHNARQAYSPTYVCICTQKSRY